MENLEFEQQETNDFEFFNFEKEGDEFIGTFKKEHDGETTEPANVKGFMFKHVDGDNIMLPHYHQIDKFLKEKSAEGVNMNETIIKIKYLKKVDIGGGQTMKRFQFFIAKKKEVIRDGSENTSENNSGENNSEEESGNGSFAKKRKK